MIDALLDLFGVVAEIAIIALPIVAVAAGTAWLVTWAMFRRRGM